MVLQAINAVGLIRSKIVSATLQVSQRFSMQW
jgi:hypothetical protein